MLDRALRLGAPEVVGGHLDRSERILLDSCGAHPDRIHPTKGTTYMTRMRIFAAAAALAAMAAAEAQTPKPEDQLKLRKAAYSLMNYSLGSIDAMVEGKRPFVKEDALRHAELLATLSTIPKGFFGEGGDKDETPANPHTCTNPPHLHNKLHTLILH